MGSKSTTHGTTTGNGRSTRKSARSLTATAADALAEDAASVTTSVPADVVIDSLAAVETAAPAAPADEVVVATPAPKGRRKSATAASTDEGAPAKRSAARTTAKPRARSKAKATAEQVQEPAVEVATESATELMGHPDAESLVTAAPVAHEAPPVASTDDAARDVAYADALAGAFLYTPEPVVADEPEDAPHQAGDLPFIVDPPPTPAPSSTSAPSPTPVPSSTPEPEGWVDQVLESPPRPASSADEWVDLVLEPSKPPVKPRSRPPVRPSARPAEARKGFTSSSAKPTEARKAATPAKVAPAKVGSSKTASAKAVPAAAAPVTLGTSMTPRTWILGAVLVVLAIVFFANRPSSDHAPVPEGVLGTWTTAFWLYENQTLEIQADTIVATLDEPEEGRYPIVDVVATEEGRETAVQITYRTESGAEKVLDFLADNDPTTALRFRSHSGLVWVRPVP